MRLEYLDDKKNVVRLRNLEQTELDRLLLRGEINRDEHEAGIQFMGACWKSGSFVKAVNWERVPTGRGEAQAGRMAVNTVAAAEPFHYMVRNAGEGPAWVVVRVVVDGQRHTRESARSALKTGLQALVEYYKGSIERREKRATVRAAALAMR